MRVHWPLIAFSLIAAVLSVGCATSTAPTTPVPATVAAAPAAAPAETTATAVANNSPENRAKTLGYKVVRRDGYQLYCKEVASIGTRIAQKVCITPAQFVTVEEQAQRDRDGLRQKASICSSNEGACGGG